MGVSTGPKSNAEGLVFFMDPSNARSYSGIGNTIYDLVSSSITGTFTNYTSGVIDSTLIRSIYLDGTDDFILCNNTSGIGLSYATVSAWFKKPQGASFKAVIDKGRDNFGAWSLCVDETANRVVFKARISGTNRSITTASNYNSNDWNHVCGVFDGTTLSIYQNGSLSNSASFSGSIDTNAVSIRLGAANDGYYLNGNLGIVSVHSRALSSTEILQNYNSNKNKYISNDNVVTNGLVLSIDTSRSVSYPGTGVTINNIAGINTGVLTNGPTFSQLNGGSIAFDGSNDYIDFGSYTPDANTVNIWVKINTLQNGPIVYVGNDTYASGSWSWSFFMYGAAFYFRANPGNLADFSEVPPLGVWINYTLIRDNGSGTSLAYKNGVYFGSSNNSTLTNAFSNLRIAKGGSTYANFNLSLVQIYNRALSAQEVLQNYNATKNRYINALPPITDSSLVLNLDAGSRASYVGTGTSWYDLSGNNNNSTLVGSPVFSGTNPLYYFSFDSNTKSATLPTSVLNNYSSGTIECSVYITNLSTSFIFARQRNGVNSYNVLSVGSYSGTTGTFASGTSGIVYYHNKNSQTILNSATALSANTWYRLAVTFNTSGVTLYINGVQNATLAGDYSVPNDLTVDPRIGAWIADSVNRPMNGRIDQFQVYSRALTASEILQNFNFYRTRYGI